MSKYSTDEMVKFLTDAYKTLGTVPALHQDIYSTIIAKLRAADKLCEAAKKADIATTEEDGTISRGDWKLHEAISEYEGEKK